VLEVLEDISREEVFVMLENIKNQTWAVFIRQITYEEVMIQISTRGKRKWFTIPSMAPPDSTLHHDTIEVLQC
jgi:hypothetical protein